MMHPILLDFFAILFAVIVVGGPFLLLRNFVPREIEPERASLFDTFRWVELGWGLFLCVYLLMRFVSHGAANYLMGLAFMLAAVTLPSAFFAAVTGLYPRNRGRALYDYLQDHRDKSKQFFLSTSIPTLRVLGCAQLVLLIAAVVFTFSRL